LENTIAQLQNKLEELNTELFHVKRANSKLKNEVRSLRREKEKKLREERKGQKQHFRNNKRGSKFQG
jgi:predicted RNase H-like nuclease (RuvC/YqgF family)